MAGRRRPTQQEVAARAGVSQGVVSQVLNGREGTIRLNPATRARVLGAMRDLGYVPNLAARSLAGGKSRIMGVFTYEPVFPTDTRDFYYPFLEGIEAAAADLDYDLLLHTRPGGGARSVYHDGASRLHLADGTLMLGFLDGARRAELARLLEEGHAAVFIGRREVPGAALTWVTADYVGATAGAVRELARLGHRSIAYLGIDPAGLSRQESSRDRLLGYHEGLREAGLGACPLQFRPEEVTPGLVRDLLGSGVTGLLIENDGLADAWQAAATALGLLAPDDYSFAVLGDPIGGRGGRGWAAFHLPRREMGREAVRLLAAVLGGEAPASVSLPCAWVPGDSLGPAFGRADRVAQGP